MTRTTLKLFAATAAAGVLAMAGAANAAVTSGTVNITGSVAAACSIDTATQSFGLGELADANGHLSSSFTGAGLAFTKNFNLTCSGANASVSVLSSPLTNTSVATAPTGYARVVNYTGRAAVDLISTGNVTSTVNVDDVSTGGSSVATVGSTNFLATTSNNLKISAFSFNTAGPTDILTAGSYSGSIVVTITP